MNTNKLPNAKTMTEEEYAAAKNAFDAKFGAILTDPENPFAPRVPLVLTDPENPDSPALNDFVPFDESELDACYACSDSEMSEMSATPEEYEARRKAYAEEMVSQHFERMGNPAGEDDEDLAEYTKMVYDLYADSYDVASKFGTMVRETFADLYNKGEI